MKVGISIFCAVCGQRKCPRGRSSPLGAYYCNWECPGWGQEPKVGSLWPGETEEDFGYPVESEGTEER